MSDIKKKPPLVSQKLSLGFQVLLTAHSLPHGLS